MLDSLNILILIKTLQKHIYAPRKEHCRTRSHSSVQRFFERRKTSEHLFELPSRIILIQSNSNVEVKDKTYINFEVSVLHNT